MSFVSSTLSFHFKNDVVHFFYVLGHLESLVFNCIFISCFYFLKLIKFDIHCSPLDGPVAGGYSQPSLRLAVLRAVLLTSAFLWILHTAIVSLRSLELCLREFFEAWL